MPTKAELESERDELLTKLEDAYVIIGEALGYEDVPGDDDEDPNEEDDNAE